MQIIIDEKQHIDAQSIVTIAIPNRIIYSNSLIDLN